LYNGRTPHTLFPHDYSSNSNLWIQNRSFKVPKNGWEIYDNDTFIKAFDTLKAAKVYAETLGVETYE
jgi:hypothetical protein